MDKFSFTKHALDRILDMALSPEQITECLLRPEATHRSRKYKNITHYRHGDVSCCVDRETLEVVTVLWADDDAWFADMSRGQYEGREYRGQRSA